MPRGGRGATARARGGEGGCVLPPHLLPPRSLGLLAPGPLPGRARLAPASRQLAAEGRPRKTRTWFGARLRGHPDVRVGPEMPPGDSQAAGTQPPHRWGHAGPAPPTPCRDARGAGVGCGGGGGSPPIAPPPARPPGHRGWVVTAPNPPFWAPPSHACCGHGLATSVPGARAPISLAHTHGWGTADVPPHPPNCGITRVPHSCTRTPCTLLGTPPLPRTHTHTCTPRARRRLSPLACARLGAPWGAPPCLLPFPPPLARFRPPLARSHAPGPPPPCKSPPSPSCAC